MREARVLIGFHAVLARLRTNPASVVDILVDEGRHDARLADVVQVAETAGVRVMRVPGKRLDGFCGGGCHQGIVFLFTIKVPNSITLTHFYKDSKEDALKPNPFCLSTEIFEEFLKSIEPIKNQVGCLIFQFEYLNKQKMISFSDFQLKFVEFYKQLNKIIPPVGIEIRNPNYLNEKYFGFLSELNIAPVFLEGYYMPPVAEIFAKFKKLVKNLVVIRLHGPDRKGIEKIANDNWNQIYINRDEELNSIVEMIKELQRNEVDLFVNVNNHFEGSAPLTIEKIKRKLL